MQAIADIRKQGRIWRGMAYLDLIKRAYCLQRLQWLREVDEMREDARNSRVTLVTMCSFICIFQLISIP